MWPDSIVQIRQGDKHLENPKDVPTAALAVGI